jgi:uncharacterized protein (TIGR02118 family)
MEHLMIAVWRAAAGDLGAMLDEWVAMARDETTVEALTISTAVEGGDSRCDALIALGLTRAHDLDDIPARDLLYKEAREVEVWRVEPHRPITSSEPTEIKRVSFVHRRDDLTHEQFVRHWTEVHAPLARVHHPGIADYTQNVVRRAYTPGGANIDGIAELRFRTRADLETRFYDSEAGKAIIRADVAEFIGQSGLATTFMTERRIKGS